MQESIAAGLENDIRNLKERIALKDKKFSDVYLKSAKNIAVPAEGESEEISKKREELRNKQKNFEQMVYGEIEKTEGACVPVIGMKGVFIKDGYYGSIERFYDDIDLIVESTSAAKIYEYLRDFGYKIDPQTLYDAPGINMKVAPMRYMENTQTLMLRDMKRKIEIDLHSNLNITNAHFTKSNTRFDTKEFFKNSKQYKDYKYIRVFEVHDDICVQMRHLMKHHIFYGKTQTGLATPIQHILDIAVLINSPQFDEKVLYERVKKYNIAAEAVFCLMLYNGIFESGRRVEAEPYMKLLEETRPKPQWLPVLCAALRMKTEDVMVGDFSKDFPKMQRAVERCENIPAEKVGWAAEALVLSLNPQLLF